MHEAPDILGTVTNPAHQHVGCLTFEMTPRDSILFSSVWTLLHRSSGIHLGAYTECGFASALSFTSYVSPKLPHPLKMPGNELISNDL